MKKIHIGSVADFSHICPVGKYAQDIIAGMPNSFIGSQIDLRSNELSSNNDNNIFDNNITQLIEKISECDVIDIHLEFGLFGHDINVVFDRIKRITMAAKRVIVTVHSLNTSEPFKSFYEKLFSMFKDEIAYKPILAIVNNKKDKDILDSFGFKSYTVFPILYFNKYKAKRIQNVNIFQDKTSTIHKKLHFTVSPHDIIIGYFGFYQPHKDYTTVLRALALLPKHYKMIIAGSERNYESEKINQTILSITQTIEELDKGIENNERKLMNRVAFINDLNQNEFTLTLASVAFVIINYLETNMSSSSIMSQSLQLGKRVISSKCTTFCNLEEFFPKSFEMIENGNHFQLRQKIISFQNDKLINLKSNNDKWSLEVLESIYKNFAEKPIRLSD